MLTQWRNLSAFYVRNVSKQCEKKGTGFTLKRSISGQLSKQLNILGVNKVCPIKVNAICFVNRRANQDKNGGGQETQGAGVNRQMAISYNCCDRQPQIQWLKIISVLLLLCFFSSLQFQNQKFEKSKHGSVVLEIMGGNSFPYSFQLLKATYIPCV